MSESRTRFFFPKWLNPLCQQCSKTSYTCVICIQSNLLYCFVQYSIFELVLATSLYFYIPYKIAELLLFQLEIIISTMINSMKNENIIENHGFGFHGSVWLWRYQFQLPFRIFRCSRLNEIDWIISRIVFDSFAARIFLFLCLILIIPNHNFKCIILEIIWDQ